jgi:hypothetical protein
MVDDVLKDARANGERLPVVIADDEAGVRLLDGPGRREAGEPLAR